MNGSQHQNYDNLEKLSRKARVYDAYVSLMRVGLTIVAVGLSVLIILWPTINEEEVSFTLSYEDVNTSDDEVRMVKPKYVGTDLANRLFSVEADEGLQLNPDDPRIRLINIRAEMDMDDGVKVEMISEAGTYLLKENLLEMAGKVRMFTTDGYRFEGSRAMFDLNTKVATSDSPVQGIGRHGSFTAQGFEVDVDKQKAIFKNGVHMRIFPVGKDNP